MVRETGYLGYGKLKLKNHSLPASTSYPYHDLKRTLQSAKTMTEFEEAGFKAWGWLTKPTYEYTPNPRAGGLYQLPPLLSILDLKRTLDYYSAKSGCLLFLFNVNGSVRKTILSGVYSITKTLTFLIIFIPITITIGMIAIKGPRNYYSTKGVNFGLLLLVRSLK